MAQQGIAGASMNVQVQANKGQKVDELKDQVQRLLKEIEKMEKGSKPNASKVVDQEMTDNDKKRSRVEQIEAELDEITLSPQPKRMRHLILDSLKVRAVVDPGCDQPVMGSQLWENISALNGDLKLTQVNVSVKVADKRALKVLGVVNLDVIFEDLFTTVPVIVVEEPLPFYLDYCTMGLLDLNLDPVEHGLVERSTGRFFPFDGC
eukprot:GHVU01212721.1.p1 GENE.GHVU01212721.1~~GHVU01212721.1.p1  ORF type:complete len:206 (+),score=36.44 GHVU01212721.1:463-1080(+)